MRFPRLPHCTREYIQEQKQNNGMKRTILCSIKCNVISSKTTTFKLFNITKQPITNTSDGYPNICSDFLKIKSDHTCTRSRILLNTRLDQVMGSIAPAS